MKTIKNNPYQGNYTWPVLLLGLALFVLTSTGFALPTSSQGPPIDGPLHKLSSNPRYFTNNSGKAVYLTGSHTWDTFQRWFANNSAGGFTSQSPSSFSAYLNVLESHNHNFIRFWVADTAYSPATGALIEPQPYLRTTSSSYGKAKDGGLKFDLNKLNDNYFNTVASLVRQARDKRIYVSLMLFDGWGTSEYGTSNSKFNTWPYHPFNAQNNINGINADTNNNGIGLEYHTAAVGSKIWNLQTAYVKRLIDAVNGYDNVLYEICNESGDASTTWQQNMINYVKNYEKSTYSKVHPVGMTYQFSGNSDTGRGSNDTLFNSPADWISPGPNASPFNYKTNPPPASGAKVIIPDTDHTVSWENNPVWVWKSFMRGLNPIVMDWWTSSGWEPIRYAMGRTRDIALNHVDLTTMLPVTDISNTGYCLAEAGKQYVGYLYTDSTLYPNTTSVASFSLNLPAGTYDAYWVSTTSDRESAATQFSTTGEEISFDAPDSTPDWILIVKASTSSPPPPSSGGGSGSTGAFLMENNQVVMEAEHAASRSAASTGQEWVDINESNASGTAIQALPNKGNIASAPGSASCRADYPISIPSGSASKFYVHIRARGANGNDDSLFVSIDGNTSTYQKLFLPQGSAVGAWITTGSFTIPAGSHSLTLWMREDGAVVDKFVLNSSGTKPTGTGPAESTQDQTSSGGNGSGGGGSSDGNSGAFLMDNNQVVMEAEHATSRFAANTGQEWVDIDESGASGASTGNAIQALANKGNIASVPGSASCRADYLIDIPAGSATKFYVHLRARGANGVDDSLFVSIDGDTSVYRKAYLLQSSAIGAWITPGSFNISSGQHTLTVWMREDGAIVDKIVLSSSGTKPSGTGPAESTQDQASSGGGSSSNGSGVFFMDQNQVVMEAEHATSRSAASTGQEWVDIDESGASGASTGNAIQALANKGNVASVPGSASCRADYRIDIPAGSATKFYLHLRARGANGVDDSLFVSIDGYTSVYRKVYLLQSSSVGTWITPGSFNIPSGQHTLTVWMREDGAIVDKIVLSSSGTKPTGSGPAESPRG